MSPLTSANLPTAPPVSHDADQAPDQAPDLDWRDRRYTFEEYCALVPPDDRRYELEDGKLILMAATAALHQDICDYLAYWLERAIADLGLDLVVKTAAGLRTSRATSRIPDLTVCDQHLWEQLRAKPGSGVLEFEQQPVLVGEVVSQNRQVDYKKKRAEYARRGVPVYLRLDPKTHRIRLDQDPNPHTATYQTTTTYSLGEQVVFPGFPTLQLTVDEVLNPPLVKELKTQERRDRLELASRAELAEQRVEEERQRAEQERQRADRLAALLRAQGIDPED